MAVRRIEDPLTVVRFCPGPPSDKKKKIMAWRIVKQPNNMLARFSDIVDNFTHYNLTESEAFDVCLEYMSKESAQRKVQRGINDIEPWSLTEKGDGLSRWRDCLDTIENVHGYQEREKIEVLLSNPAKK